MFPSFQIKFTHNSRRQHTGHIFRHYRHILLYLSACCSLYTQSFCISIFLAASNQTLCGFHSTLSVILSLLQSNRYNRIPGILPRSMDLAFHSSISFPRRTWGKYLCNYEFPFLQNLHRPFFKVILILFTSERIFHLAIILKMFKFYDVVIFLFILLGCGIQIAGSFLELFDQ